MRRERNKTGMSNRADIVVVFRCPVLPSDWGHRTLVLANDGIRNYSGKNMRWFVPSDDILSYASFFIIVKKWNI